MEEKCNAVMYIETIEPDDAGAKTKKKLECYCCKQQLKDSNVTFTLTLKVNKC